MARKTCLNKGRNVRVCQRASRDSGALIDETFGFMCQRWYCRARHAHPCSNDTETGQVDGRQDSRFIAGEDAYVVDAPDTVT